jgi:hypothetical protein
MAWSRRFEDPILLPDGRKLTTLKQAAEYVIALPKKEHAAPQAERKLKPDRQPSAVFRKYGFVNEDVVS